MKKSEIIKNSIEENIINDNEVLNNIISSRIKRNNRRKAVAAIVMCLIIGFSVMSPIIIRAFIYKPGEIIEESEEASGDISVNANNSPQDEAIAFGESIIKIINNKLNYTVDIDAFSSEYINEAVDVLTVPVYKNKHDGKDFNTYLYGEFEKKSASQVTQEVIEGNSTKEIKTDFSFDEYKISAVIYLSGDECDYYIPFYMVAYKDSVYFVPAVKE